MVGVLQIQYRVGSDNLEQLVRPVHNVWGLDLYGSLVDSVSRFWDCLKEKRDSLVKIRTINNPDFGIVILVNSPANGTVCINSSVIGII